MNRMRYMVIGVCALTLAAAGCAVASVPENSKAPQSGWFVDMNRFAESAHAALQCKDCHGTMQENGKVHPDPKDPKYLKADAVRTFDYKRCQPCHMVSYQRYLKGEHAKALEKQMKTADQPLPDAAKQAPACGNCHSSHYDRSGLSRLDIGRRMVDICGKCHFEHAASYLKNSHGRRGVDLGDSRSAFCTDCHGAHTALSLKTTQNALSACLRCHPKADQKFAGAVIHADLKSHPSPDSEKFKSVQWLYRIKAIAATAAGLSFLFFFGHSILWLLREVHHKLRREENEKE